MNKYYSVLHALLLFTGLSVQALAGPCDAYYRFDGDLSDESGNGNAGQMIGAKGTRATPQFVEGRSGQALKLDGSAAMRAFVDLNRDRCPQATVTAWVKIASAPSQTILGTGGGPWLWASNSLLMIRTAGKDLTARDAIYANGGWMFVAAVWDHESGTHRLHWHSRQAEDATGKSPPQAEPAIWVGAYNDALHFPAKDLVIDELRIIGRALETERIMAMRDAPAGGGQAQPAMADTAGQACSSHAGCPAGSYCGMDGTCHPDSYRPMQSAGGGTTLQDLQGGTTNRAGTVDFDAQTDLLQDAGSGDGGDMGDSNRLSPESEQALANRAAEMRGPEIEYESEEAAEEAARQREAAAAEAEAEAEASMSQNGGIGGLRYFVRYSTDILAFSGVSGGVGDYTEQFVSTDAALQGSFFRHLFPYWIETRENYDKPCTVYVHSRAIQAGSEQPEPSVREFDVCNEGLPRINPLTTLHRAVVEPRAGEFGLMTGIQVCNNGINKRVKGIRARVRGLRLETATYSSDYTTRVFQERTNCVSWDEMVHCSANTFAVGLRLHFRDGDVVSPRDFLSGLELLCTEVEVLRGSSSGWEPVPHGG